MPNTRNDSQANSNPLPKQRPGRGAPPEAEPAKTWYGVVKVILGTLAALVLIVLAAPILLVCALLVKFTSRGPVIYSQIRVGRYGRPYRIYKLRTMYHECERTSGPCWSTAGD